MIHPDIPFEPIIISRWREGMTINGYERVHLKLRWGYSPMSFASVQNAIYFIVNNISNIDYRQIGYDIFIGTEDDPNQVQLNYN